MVRSRKTSFHFDYWPTYFRSNIHQNSPKILGVNTILGTTIFFNLPLGPKLSKLIES
jgi:hypothetical protein